MGMQKDQLMDLSDSARAKGAWHDRPLQGEKTVISAKCKSLTGLHIKHNEVKMSGLSNTN